MPHVVFTSHLQRFVSCPEHDVEGDTLGGVLDQVFKNNPRLRDYILDDQDGLRKHVIVFIDGRRTKELKDPVKTGSEVHVLQALSGG